MQAARQKQSKASPLSSGTQVLGGDGQWWTHSWAVVVTRRRVRLRLRLLLRLASVFPTIHRTPEL